MIEYMKTKYNPFDNYAEFKEYLLQARRTAIENKKDVNVEQIILDVTGLQPDTKADLHNDISGQIALDAKNRTYHISVNKNDHYYRQRFTMAHELGHYVLHRNYLGLGVDDNTAYRSLDTGRFKNNFITPLMETDANKFAAWVLMPFGLIKKFQADLGITDLKNISDNDKNELSKKLKISKDALKIRLEHLKSKDLI